jgi:hypothetical protein
MTQTTVKKNTVTLLVSFFWANLFAQSKPIDIKHSFVINTSIDKAWKVLGPGFKDAYKWASAVNHSDALDSNSLNGSSCIERGCNVSGIGNIKEKLLQYDTAAHIIAYEINEGMPAMVKYAENTWQLIALADGTCKLVMVATIKTGGFIGKMMKGVMKSKMTKLTYNAAEEFKYYIENNEQAHPRKIKAAEKYKKKQAA